LLCGLFTLVVRGRVVVRGRHGRLLLLPLLGGYQFRLLLGFVSDRLYILYYSTGLMRREGETRCKVIYLRSLRYHALNRLPSIM
jgi:hypothetical protein